MATVLNRKEKQATIAWAQWREPGKTSSSMEDCSSIHKSKRNSSGKTTLRSCWPPSLGRAVISSNLKIENNCNDHVIQQSVYDTPADRRRTPSPPFDDLVDRTGGRHLELHPCVLDRHFVCPEFPSDDEHSSTGVASSTQDLMHTVKPKKEPRPTAPLPKSRPSPYLKGMRRSAPKRNMLSNTEGIRKDRTSILSSSGEAIKRECD